jgi:mannosyltransferase
VWFDESVSIQLASEGWRPMIRALTGLHSNAVLHTLALRVWGAVLGWTEADVRWLSVAAAAVAAAFVVLTARRLYGVAASIVAGLVFALNPVALLQAREARMYAFVMMFTAASLYALVSWVDDRTPGRLGLWALAASLAAVSHPLATLVIVTEVGAVVLFAPVSRRDRLSAVVAAALASVPPAVFTVLGLRSGQRAVLGWIPRRNLFETARLLKGLAGARLSPVVFIAASVVLAVSALKLLRRGRGRSRELFSLALPLASFAGPVSAIVAISVVQPLLVLRYFSMCLPAIGLIVGAAAVRLRRGIGFAVAALMVVALITELPGLYRYTKPDWRSATALYVADARPDDRVVVLPAYDAQPFRYYAARGHMRPRIVTAPDAEVALARRVWIIQDGHMSGVTEASGAPPVVALLRGGRVVRDRSFGRIRVRLLVVR